MLVSEIRIYDVVYDAILGVSRILLQFSGLKGNHQFSHEGRQFNVVEDNYQFNVMKDKRQFNVVEDNYQFNVAILDVSRILLQFSVLKDNHQLSVMKDNKQFSVL